MRSPPGLAAFLWLLGFGVLMPGVGVQRGFWSWGSREYLLTGVAHLSYGLVTTLVLEALDDPT